MNDFRKNAIVTGATGAIGTAIARQLAVKGFDVTIIARNEQKALKTVNEIQTSSKNHNVSFLLADLSVKSSIQQLASNWERPLHVLINNAAVTPRTREETNEGIELQWATNVLGYFWMINCFTPFLKMAAPARVVNVARMLTIVFAEKLKPFGITVNAVHPGDVNSTLSNNLGYGGFQTPDQGADTPVWAATQPELTDITGKYFERREETTCQFASNKPLAYKLFEICERY